MDEMDRYDPWAELAALSAQRHLRQSAKPCPTCGQWVLWRHVNGRNTRFNLNWERHHCSKAALANASDRRRQAAQLQQELDAGFERGIRG